MSLRDRITELTQLAEQAAQAPPGEMQAQYLAASFRQVLLENTPGDLPQLHFLCILAATLGRFARDAAQPGQAGPLGTLLAAVVKRHAEHAPIADS